MKFLLAAVILSVHMRILFAQLVAPFCTGIDADGTDDDWLTCSAEPTTMDLRQSGSNPQTLQNALRVRFAHDNSHIYVLAEVDADYYFQLGFSQMENRLTHAFSVMWRIGESATMQDMGGCPIPGLSDQTDCDAADVICDANNGADCECSDYLTDIWFVKHAFQGIIPGAQYPLRIPIITTDLAGTIDNRTT